MSSDDLKRLIEEHTDAIFEECPLQITPVGKDIPDGLSTHNAKPAGGKYRLHVNLQQSLPGGLVIRFRLAIPMETANNPNTWAANKLLFFVGTEKS